MTITHLQLLSLPVTDQDRTRAFFVDTLGFDLVTDSPMPAGQGGDRWVQVAPKGATTGITLVTWLPTMPAGNLKGLVLQTDDLDGDYARLRAAGLPSLSEPTDAPWGRFVTFDDPDGNGIVLSGPPPFGDRPSG